MPAPLNINDPRFNLSIPNYPFTTAAVPFGTLFTALANLTIVGGVNTITLSGTTYTMTTKDARTYVATLNPVTDTRSVTSGAFVLAEFLSQNPVIEAVLRLMALGVSSITVTYT